MNSDLPKVAHEVAGAPMVRWVIDACARGGCGRIILVVGHGRGLIEQFASEASAPQATVETAVQEQQHGTGHAVQCAQGALAGFDGPVVVLAGDGPLIRGETIAALVRRHVEADAAATLATAVIDDPSGYGRIVRDDQGAFTGIVEEKEAAPEQRAIREINPSVYCFDAQRLFAALERVERSERSGEYYLTDVPGLLLAEGAVVQAVDVLPAEEALSVNTPEQLRDVDETLRRRLAAVES